MSSFFQVILYTSLKALLHIQVSNIQIMRQQRAELDFTEDKEVAVMGNEISGPHDEEDNDGDGS